MFTKPLAVLEDIRADAVLKPEQRFEAVAWSQQVTISRQAISNRVTRLQAQEVATRALISEFPTVSYGYGSLLAIARESSPERGVVIAREVLGMAGAPQSTKAGAQLTVDRFGLVNQSLDGIFAQHSAASLSAARVGKVTVIYGWSGTSPQALEFIRQLAIRTPDVAFIGICLDPDVEPAKRIFTAAAVGGTPFYDNRGAAGSLCSALRIDRPAVVYLADKTGTIRDVQGRDNFQVKVTALVKEGQP